MKIRHIDYLIWKPFEIYDMTEKSQATIVNAQEHRTENEKHRDNFFDITVPNTMKNIETNWIIKLVYSS